MRQDPGNFCCPRAMVRQAALPSITVLHICFLLVLEVPCAFRRSAMAF